MIVFENRDYAVIQGTETRQITVIRKLNQGAGKRIFQEGPDPMRPLFTPEEAQRYLAEILSRCGKTPWEEDAALFSGKKPTGMASNVYRELKEYLYQLFTLDQQIESHRQELYALRRLSKDLVSNPYEPLSPTNRPGDEKAIDVLEKILALEKQILQEIDQRITLQTDIHTAIERVSDGKERLLLRYRYIDFLKWEEIADKMNFSLRNIHRLHSRALSGLQEVISHQGIAK